MFTASLVTIVIICVREIVQFEKQKQYQISHLVIILTIGLNDGIDTSTRQRRKK